MTKKTRPTPAKKPQVTGNSGQLTLAQARRLTQNKPGQPEGWKALSVQLMKADQYQEAYESLSRALELSPNDPEAVARLGYVEHKLNKPEQALASLNRALELEPDSLLANIGFAKLYKDHGHYQKALAHIEAAERLSPKDIVVMDAKGGILHALYRFEEAMDIFDRLTQVDPKNFVHWNNAGNVRRGLGLLKEATDCYRKADSLAGNNFTPYSNYLTSLHYLPEFSRVAIFKVCQEWETRFAPAEIPQRPHPSNSALNKRLRIGMFSDGFRQHPVGLMTISALESVDRSAFELFAYSTSGLEDPITRRFKQRVDHWTLIQHLDDEAFAQQVRDDEIDIFIDLSGHNSGNRMRTMAMQPAPLLVKWVGGLINTTGVTAIDYLISDSIETPAGEDEYYTEKLIRLPDDYICFEPPENAPTVQALPALSNGHITLGCFNNPTKLNEVVLAEWASLMHQLPDSRLFLKGRPYNSQAYCERLQNFMAEQGIGIERLILEGPGTNHEMLEAYNRTDIALDPWPYSGGLTTCEAFLMGVPVVTMPGPTFAGRHSATHLVNAGMPELVTHSWDEYRQRVIGLASDLDSLSTIRTHLRDILLQSPVCDAPRFAKHFTTAMRAIWQRYCEGKQPAALTLNKEGEAQFEDEAQPIELVHPEPLEDESEFKWEFTGNITTLDNGAVLTSTPAATKLLGLGAFAMISFDPASKVAQPEKLQAAGEFHHYPHVVLGDGNPATLYACLDPAMSATLRPLVTLKTLTGEEPGPKVLTQLPVNSIPLDKIEGLGAIDWLILDNMNDSLAVLENGEKALEKTLLIQARVNFQPTHENQPELTLISHWAARHGFSFYRLDNETHISHLPKRDNLIERQATQLVSADAIYIPNAEHMVALDNNQRMKLAFVLHTVYGIKDIPFKLVQAASSSLGARYLENFNNKDKDKASASDSEASPIQENTFHKQSNLDEKGTQSLATSVERLKKAIKGKEIIFLGTGEIANHGIIQSKQNALKEKLLKAGIKTSWVSKKHPTPPHDFLETILRKDVICYGSNRYYDARLHASGTINSNIFDLTNTPLLAFIGDHPYATFMADRIANAAKTGFMYGFPSLIEELRFLRPDLKFVGSTTLPPPPPVAISDQVDHSERDIDVFVPMNLTYACLADQITSSLMREASSIGDNYSKLVNSTLNNYNDFSKSLLTTFRGEYKEIFSTEWRPASPWSSHDKTLIRFLGKIDDIVRGKKRLEALKNLARVSGKFKVVVTEKEEVKNILLSKIPELSTLNFIGNTTAEKTNELYKRSRYVFNINPTYHDGVHERLLSAAASGCAVITNSNKALKSLFTHQTNVLFLEQQSEIHNIVSRDTYHSQTIGVAAKIKIDSIFSSNAYEIDLINLISKYIESRSPVSKVVKSTPEPVSLNDGAIVGRKTKIFCIGRNKTGTTSLQKAFLDLGFKVGNQREAEILTDKHYFNGDFDPIINYCEDAEVFQDTPFSYPDTFKHLDTAFPGSKFILTVRSNSEQWYRSITRFHAKKFGGGDIPTANELKNAGYVRKGFMYNFVKLHGTQDHDPYNKDILISHYEKHNREVIQYFKDRPDDLLIIDLSEPGAYKRFIDFIGISSPYESFPWENKT